MFFINEWNQNFASIPHSISKRHDKHTPPLNSLPTLRHSFLLGHQKCSYEIWARAQNLCHTTNFIGYWQHDFSIFTTCNQQYYKHFWGQYWRQSTKIIPRKYTFHLSNELQWSYLSIIPLAWFQAILMYSSHFMLINVDHIESCRPLLVDLPEQNLRTKLCEAVIVEGY